MEDTHTHAYQPKIKKLPGSRIEISAIVPAEEFTATRQKAVRSIQKDAELPGFRKGHVPESMIVSRIGEAAILEEMAEIAISHAYPAIIIAEKLDVLGRPEVKVTKLAIGNPLEFTITTAIFPEISLPDYKSLAGNVNKKTEAPKVSDDDVEKTVNELRKMRARTETPDGKELDENAPLPELDDVYVKTLGDFTDVADLKEKLKENIQKEKEREGKDKQRMAIVEAILKETKFELPAIVIEEELKRMEDEFAADIERMGMKMDQYLQAVKKTRDELLGEMRPDAEKRAKTQLVVAKIAEAEDLKPDTERLEKEVAELKKRYPDANDERVRGFVHMLHTNQKVFEFLESQ